MRVAISLALLIFGLFIADHFQLFDWMTDIEKLQSWFSGLGIWGYAIYIMAYLMICVLLLPGTVLTILAGIVFGPIMGGCLALLAATSGATAAFIVARHVFRDTIVNKFGDNPIFKKIDDGVTQNGTSFLILTRLVPIFPYNLQNYAYGLTRLDLGTYVIVSLLTMAPSSFIYAYLAGDIATNGFSPILLTKFAIAGVVLFGISLIPKFLVKNEKKKTPLFTK